MPAHLAAPISLSSLLQAKHTLLAYEASSKKRLFEDIGFLFEETHQINRRLITDSLFSRERLGSTGLGHGVAIPHGRIKGLKEPLVAFVQLHNPIGFDAIDDAPVRLLFVLLVPENATQRHLDLLSEIAEVLSDENKRRQLQSATTMDDIMRTLHAGTLL